MKYCHICGAELEDDAEFCNKCGVKMIPAFDPAPVEEPAPVVQEEKTKAQKDWEARAKIADIVGATIFGMSILLAVLSIITALPYTGFFNIVYLGLAFLFFTGSIACTVMGNNKSRPIAASILSCYSLLFVYFAAFCHY